MKKVSMKMSTCFCRVGAMFMLPIVAISMFLVDIGAAEAVPAFARKFQANCALCHTNVPRLAPFGQQFLANGYQFPGTMDGGDTAKIKLDGAQGPVTLDTLSNMMAVRLRGDIQKASFKNEPGDGVDDRWAIEMPKIVNFFFGGTVAENISYFIESEYNTMESDEPSVKFERAVMQFSNLGGVQGVANVKVGRFDPSSLFSFPTHRQQLNPILPIADTGTYPPMIQRIPLLPYAFSSKLFGMSTAGVAAGTAGTAVGDGFSLLPFAPTLYNAPVQNGISIHGRPGGGGSPLLYQIGLALNDKADGTAEQRTDVYAMLRFDFQAAGADAQISGFWYNAPDAARSTLLMLGNVQYADSATDITRVGIGARAQWETVDVYFAYTQDSIDNPTWNDLPNAMMIAAANSSEWQDTATGFSLEADWRFDPNWMLGVRYDQMDAGGLERLPAGVVTAANDKINATVQMISPILKYYPSPNIALYTRAHINISSSSTLPDTNGQVAGFSGQEHPASNLENVLTLGVDMAF
ncbi:MAG: TonB-dependent receptor [Gammaproteobacteria bacterium]|nr:TonB-dependent receptor [Gammaproteobacteria bacterium]